MSAPDLELVRHIIDTWNAAGPEQAVRQFFAEDAEYHTPPDMPDRRIVTGREAIVAYFQEITDLLGQLRLNIIELLPCADEVFALAQMELIGAHSHADVWGEIAVLFRLEGERLKRVRAFSRDEGLAIAGIRG